VSSTHWSPKHIYLSSALTSWFKGQDLEGTAFFQHCAENLTKNALIMSCQFWNLVSSDHALLLVLTIQEAPLGGANIVVVTGLQAGYVCG
jgi:hypothetical protein